MITNKNIIDKSLSLFNDLSKILDENKTDDIQYQISEVKYIINLLTECKSKQYDNFEKIIEEVSQAYKRLYPARGGLTEFFIWKSDFDERVKANENLDKISDELWQIFN